MQTKTMGINNMATVLVGTRYQWEKIPMGKIYQWDKTNWGNTIDRNYHWQKK